MLGSISCAKVQVKWNLNRKGGTRHSLISEHPVFTLNGFTYFVTHCATTRAIFFPIWYFMYLKYSKCLTGKCLKSTLLIAFCKNVTYKDICCSHTIYRISVMVKIFLAECYRESKAISSTHVFLLPDSQQFPDWSKVWENTLLTTFLGFL